MWPVGEVPNFRWRIQDHVDALIRSGFIISRMEEFHSVVGDIPACSYLFEETDINHDNFNWRNNPYAAMPSVLDCAVIRLENKQDLYEQAKRKF